MKKNGRPYSEKIWDHKIRHVFNTDFAKDPDIHILMFILGDQATNVIRQGLRDYMAATKSKALEPAFRERVFMTASQYLVRGENSGPTSVLNAIGEGGKLPASPNQVARTYVSQKSPVSNSDPIGEAPKLAHTHEVAGPVATQNGTLEGYPQKAPPVLDFGPDVVEDTSSEGAAPAKRSQKDKWLSQHKY